jgi:hypothetical protein
VSGKDALHGKDHLNRAHHRISRKVTKRVIQRDLHSARLEDRHFAGPANQLHPESFAVELDRTGHFGRNSFKTPTLANMDFRILKYFPFGETAKLDIVAEAFNPLNRANAAQVNPVFGLGTTALPGFLQPLSVLRSTQNPVLSRL